MTEEAITPLPVFDDIEARKGLVQVLSSIIGDDLAYLKIQDSSGTWVETDSRAIYLSPNNNISEDYPKVGVGFLGSVKPSSGLYDKGIAKVVHPTTGEEVTVPYEQTYIKYTIYLVADSGDISLVHQGLRKSASRILEDIRDNIANTFYTNLVNEVMCSSVNTVSQVTPQDNVDTTVTHNSSTMNLVFDMISTRYDYDNTTSYFESVEQCGSVTYKN